MKFPRSDEWTQQNVEKVLVRLCNTTCLPRPYVVECAQCEVQWCRQVRIQALVYRHDRRGMHWRAQGYKKMFF
jgi:hypothetical protein